MDEIPSDDDLARITAWLVDDAGYGPPSPMCGPIGITLRAERTL